MSVVPRDAKHAMELARRARARAKPGYKEKAKAQQAAYYRDPENRRRKLEYFHRRSKGMTADQRTEHSLKYKYGLTLQQYWDLFAEQGGVCVLCRRPPKSDRRLAVHHDHATGKVVCLLHLGCNTMLGIVGDSSDGMKTAADRLRRWETRKRQ